jgi:eukaryotic-like serine/threonine-protein kinase
MIGTKLGPYEILEKIGAGGMGEVYRARDTRLGRDVAVKVLPEGLTTDPNRLRRFEQEARSAGMLNHPNILAIYDIGTHDGTPFVVSELLDGETLRARLGGSALPQRKAVELAIQIAQGLAAAHEKGITHRDLKPENLFITRDGRLKILDFGLAKLTHLDVDESAFTNLPTTPAHTDPGIVLGTAGYMSPEQVRGRPADHRSDLFTFGAILYEMLTGARAFKRESAVETMNAILKEDPPEVSTTGARLPPGLDRIVRHCMEKNPEERFQSARDLAFDLQSLSGSVESSVATAGISARAPRKSALLWGALGVLALVGVAAAAYVAGSRSVPAPASQVEFKIQTFRRGIIYNALFTPDGQSIVFGAAWDGNPFEIFLKRPESPESRSLGIENVEPLAISKTGELAILLHRKNILGWMSSGTLARMSLSGGAPREIAENVGDADWSPDGSSLAAAVYRQSGRAALEFPLGKVVYESAGWVGNPRFSRDGSKIAFANHPVTGDDRGVVMFVDLKSGKATELTKAWSTLQGIAWSADGSRIYFTAADVGIRTLRSVDLSGSDRIVMQVPGGVTLHDIAPDGRMLITTDLQRRGIIGLAPGESKERDLSWLDWSSPSDLSADGQWLLFEEQAAGSGDEFYAMYLRRTDGSPAIRIGEGLARKLSSDGKWILAVQDKPSRHLALLPTGAGESRVIPGTEIARNFGHALLPDGSGVVFTGEEPGKPRRMYRVDFQSGARKPVTQEGVAGNLAVVSADGKRVALSDPQSGIGIYPLEGGEPRTYTGIPGETRQPFPLNFTPDGKQLYVLGRGGPLANIYLLDLATGKWSLWKQLASSERMGILDFGPALMTPDGKSYVYSYRQMLSTLFLVTGLGQANQ